MGTQRFRATAVEDRMTADMHSADKGIRGDYVVRRPRATDALGHALRGVYPSVPGPHDFDDLLKRLDRVTH